MKKSFFRLNSLMLSVAVTVGALFLPLGTTAYASQEESGNLEYNVTSDYIEYLNNAKYPFATEKISLKGGEYSTISGDKITVSDYENRENVLIWQGEEGSVTYTFDVPSNGLYNIELEYLPLKGNELNIEYSLMIDGKLPFSALERLELVRFWVNDGDVKTDKLGNEYAPTQKEYGKFITDKVFDPTGVITEDIQFALNAGRHTITIDKKTQPVVISQISLVPCESVKSYSEVKAEYEKKGYKIYSGTPFSIEGEAAYLKSTRSLVPKSDTSSASITPISTNKTVINYIGSSNWKAPTDELVWKINVKESGLYNIGVNFKQDMVINGFSYRWLKIDGVTPFAEAKQLPFYYDINWQFSALGEEEEPYLFYLSEGEHEISLSVTMGDTSEYYLVLEEMVEKIGDLYLEIVTITGSTPDANRDYDLFRQITNFNERLTQYRDVLKCLANKMESLSGKRGSQYVAAINNMCRVINNILDNPYTAQNYLSDYYNNYTALGSWLYEMKGMPLSLDQIRFASPDGEFESTKKGFFGSSLHSIKRFFITFTKDYGKIASEESEGATLKLWVNWGRDQAMVLSSLIREYFTPKTGINVNLEITNASLIKGMLSNIQPDLSLHLARTEPVNLAMRGALYDISQFEDYEDVIKNFGEYSVTPYEYNGGVYALPDTQAFYIMFYRTDIFEDLNLTVPKTWDEFIRTASVIQRNNLQVYLPYTQITAASTVNTGVGGLNLFGSILQQFGGDFYNNERTLCDLDSETSFKAFTFWTDLYTKYRVPTTSNFYNRFRSGTVPMGIEVYTTYTTLVEAAPEIQGRWDIAMVPGLEQEDGSIKHTVSGSGTGCSILSKSKNKNEAWEFLKWWTSAETQLMYNNNVESILGSVSRVTTANVKAFEGMSWDRQHLKVLLEQREWIKEVPEVPGSYYLSRSVDQAFWAVYNEKQNPKDVLLKWADIANSEITRKIEEYSK